MFSVHTRVLIFTFLFPMLPPLVHGSKHSLLFVFSFSGITIRQPNRFSSGWYFVVGPCCIILKAFILSTGGNMRRAKWCFSTVATVNKRLSLIHGSGYAGLWFSMYLPVLHGPLYVFWQLVCWISISNSLNVPLATNIKRVVMCWHFEVHIRRLACRKRSHYPRILLIIYVLCIRVSAALSVITRTSLNMHHSNSIEVGFFTIYVSLLEKYFPAPFWCVKHECPSLFRPG